jgi:Zinc knuckle
LRGVRDNIVHICTRCGQSGHVAKDCFQLRSATHDSDSDNYDPPLTPVRNQPPLNSFIPKEVTDDDTTEQNDSISAHLDQIMILLHPLYVVLVVSIEYIII